MRLTFAVWKKLQLLHQKMDERERLFSTMVREHKSTIYTVCYMFSKDPDEVNDNGSKDRVCKKCGAVIDTIKKADKGE